MTDSNSRLSGNQSQVVDSKNRVVIPSKFRDPLGAKVKVGLHPQDNFFVLMICNPEVYKIRMDALEKRAEADRNLTDTITLIEGMTEELELDDQGRVTLTPELKGYAGIERDVIVLGRGDHLQVWTQGRWDDFKKKALETPGGMRDSLFRRSQ